MVWASITLAFPHLTPFSATPRPIARPTHKRIARNLEQISLIPIGEAVTELSRSPELVVTDYPGMWKRVAAPSQEVVG
jgi:hypothetical protein